jgi:2-polyprenyl-6-hydroxyphenyl methylase/3-demethylubiquinone-9 3-methyltransferase
MTEGPRFRFGKNWLDFVRSVSERQLLSAQTALVELLSTESLDNQSFLDVGCGSGIASLVTGSMGAKYIHSFDFDDESVSATRTLVARSGATQNWTVEQGSLTDSEYLAGLGTFDIVHACGVIHHTGSMWEVAGALPALVNPEGRLVIAIYNDQGLISSVWRVVKRLYAMPPPPM